MTDRELLEAAAKAAGLTIEYWAQDDYPVVRDGAANVGWSPLTFDSDALRLAVKLDMIVSVGRVEFGDFDTWEDSIDMPEADVRLDPYAATRRAIVRAAAAIAQEKTP